MIRATAGMLVIVIRIVMLVGLAALLPLVAAAGLLIHRITGIALEAGPPLCRLALRLLLVEVIVADRTAPDTAARLLVANHVSWLDVLVLASREPLCFLAKREVGSWPLIAGFARAQGAIFHDRARRRAIPRTNRTMAERLGGGRSVALFPEGTTHDGRRRGRFLTSHLACLRDRLTQGPDIPSGRVQAVALAYSDPAAAWVGDATLLPHVWRLLRGPGIACALAYGEPVRVERGYDRKVLGKTLAGDVDALVGLAERCLVGREPAILVEEWQEGGILSPRS